MKRLLIALVVAGAAVWAAVAVATPGAGQSNKIVALGTIDSDLAYNTGLTMSATGLTWEGKQYSAQQLPEFLARLRTEGVTDLGAWLNLHPVASAKFGLVPLGVLKGAEIVTQQATFAPGATSGWHSHPGFLTATVVSGQVVRYGVDCSSTTYAAGQSFYETGARTFVVRNEGTVPAVVMVTFAVPGGTPTTALRIDEPQPTSCSK